MAKTVWELTRLETVLLSMLVGRERYGLEIRDAAGEVGQDVSLASLYTTLNRLEKAGLVRGRWGAPTEIRRGARRRYYALTALGEQALRDTRHVWQRVLRRLPALGLVGMPVPS
ncbi:MAG TPA: PadR family transcriptional regulator [Methylomirabilota bacterium]|nr:PadR family transcriptional regulator [Methylomirabilota bacterium]